jgi:tRNA-intron endonuclease
MVEKQSSADGSEIRAKGVLKKKGVKIAEKSSIDALSQRGYGITENNIFTLSFYEALYLQDKNLLEVKDNEGKVADFQRLLRCYEAVDENAWVNYLVYRDLRSRGYVVREGFGAGIAFRIYERGAYGKDTAQYLDPRACKCSAAVSKSEERANFGGDESQRRSGALLGSSIIV